MNEPVVVGHYHYRHEAEYAQGVLESAGIEAFLFADDAGGMEVGLTFSNLVRLVVRAEDAEHALAVLRVPPEDTEAE